MRRHFWFLTVLVITGRLAPRTQNAHAAAPSYRTVALSGDHAPGTPPELRFSSFNGPAISEFGQIVFTAEVAGPGVDGENASGVWREQSPGALGLVARSGDQAPGLASGVIFGVIRGANSDDFGRVAFHVLLDGAGVTSDNSGSIWAESSLGLQLVFREGPAPGLPGYTTAPSASPLINANGDVAFYAQARSGGSLPENETVILTTAGGALHVAVSERHAGVGDIYFSTGLFSDSGHVAFSDFDSIQTDRTGSITAVARTRDQAPGTPAGTTFFTLADRPAINGNDQIAFHASLHLPSGSSEGTSGIWSEGGGNGLALVARMRTAAPGVESALFAGFAPPVINDDGQVVFSARMTGPGINSSNDQGLWVGDEGSLRLAARTGDVAPGVTDAAMFQNLSFPVINGNGRLAFDAPLFGPGVNATNDIGIWVEDRVGQLQLVAREGDQFDVDDGPGVDLRTIATLVIGGNSGNQDGRAQPFNELGYAAFRATFTDGSAGLFVSDIGTLPEPSSLSLIAVAALLLKRKSRAGLRSR